MEIFVLGTSHRIASAPVRERLHVDADRARATLARLTGPGRTLVESAVLSTCGRLEIYGAAEHPTRARRLLERLERSESRLSAQELEAHTFFHVGGAAVVHLFRVAAGLESAIQGEAQILGQVRALATEPRSTATMGPILRRLGESAVAAGKRVRAETDIGRGAASLAGASLELVARRLGSLEGRTAVVIGAGETGALVARLLRKAGIGRLRVVNRTRAHADALASEIGGSAHALSELVPLLGDADLVVAAASAPSPLVDRALAERAWGHEARARYVLDLAHPRNVAPDVAELPGVALLDLEDVQRRIVEARAARAAQVPRAQAIVDDEAERYLRWMRGRASLHVVRVLRERVLSHARREAERHGRGLDPDQREALQRAARSVARSLLHHPTLMLREADPETPEGRRLLDSAHDLFQLASTAAGETVDEDEPRRETGT